MALEGARGVKGDFTPLPGLARRGARAGNAQQAPAASLAARAAAGGWLWGRSDGTGHRLALGWSRCFGQKF